MGYSPENRVFDIIEGMDVYLSEEARRFLDAQALELSRRRVAGLLLGHRRGQRFFIESVYPCSLQPLLSLKQYHALSRIFNDRIIGFYASGKMAKKSGRKIPPFAVNKLFLELDSHPRKGLALRPAVVEYSGSFEFVPVALARPMK